MSAPFRRRCGDRWGHPCFRTLHDVLAADAQPRGGHGPQPLERDRPRTHLAEAIGTDRQARLCGVDLGEHATVTLLESREDTARHARRRIVQKVAWMMPLTADELVVGHDECAVCLATLAAKATLELSDAPSNMAGHGARPPLTASKPPGRPDALPGFSGAISIEPGRTERMHTGCHSKTMAIR